MILSQRIGTMHQPNKYYLEYVSETLVKEAISYLCTTRYRPVLAKVVDTVTNSPSLALPTRTSARRPIYLSNFASTQLLSSWVSSMLFTHQQA